MGLTDAGSMELDRVAREELVDDHRGGADDSGEPAQ